MKNNNPRLFLSVFAGCFIFSLAGTAFALTEEEKEFVERERAKQEKVAEALKLAVDALIAKEADPNDAKSIYELGVRYLKDKRDPLVGWDLYQRAAEMGYADAQYAIGMEYIEHIQEIVPREAAKAEGAKWLEKAAEQGHVEAQLELAKCYSSGKGVKKDEAEALKWAQKAAESGDAKAMYEYYQFSGKLEMLLKSAENGYVEAQNRLGFCYLRAIIFPVDLSEAVKWYTLAAEQGDSGAKKHLDRLKDVIPLLEPAERGDAEAQYKLARYIIEHGEIGDSPNNSGPRREEIRKWLLKAAENGHVAAQLELAEAYAWFDNGIWWIAPENDFAEAAKWFRKAAEQGDPMGQGMLGWLYATGRGVDKDLKTAVEWFRKGAAQGNAEAQFGMGFSVRDSWLEPYYNTGDKDWKIVADWYVKAADSGLKHSLPELENKRDYTGLQCKIAELYRLRYALARPNKDGSAGQYLAEAVNWYRKAAEAHDSDGFYKLCDLAEQQDCKEAKAALRTLAKNGNKQAQTFLGANGWDEPEQEGPAQKDASPDDE